MSAPSGKRASKARPRGSTANVIAEPATAARVGTVARGNVEIEPEEIARLAYSYWEARGGRRAARRKRIGCGRSASFGLACRQREADMALASWQRAALDRGGEISYRVVVE